jgi:hypothetical protein
VTMAAALSSLSFYLRSPMSRLLPAGLLQAPSRAARSRRRSPIPRWLWLRNFSSVFLQP